MVEMAHGCENGDQVFVSFDCYGTVIDYNQAIAAFPDRWPKGRFVIRNPTMRTPRRRTRNGVKHKGTYSLAFKILAGKVLNERAFPAQ
jgi:hypothetical protein